MKIVIISDTHGQHDNLIIPTGDMIIHAGDVSEVGDENRVKCFLKWFSNLEFKYRIFISGNHDFYFEKEKKEIIVKIIPDNIIYLNDSQMIINNLKIWGSPVQPWFYNWAFNRQRGADIKKHWDLIPTDTDIVITHGPPFGILDKTITNEKVGCKDLYSYIQKIEPKFHIFGHIHEAYGKIKKDKTIFINASVLNHRYKIKNKPIILNI